jgi:hypothetical protein
MRKLLILPLAWLAIIGTIVPGCSNTPIIVEKMVISPDTLVLHPADSATTVSITHTCTCPFSWSATVYPASNWLVSGQNISSYQSGDKSDVAVSINRYLLTADTSRAMIHIASNAYGEDSILVIAIK